MLLVVGPSFYQCVLAALEPSTALLTLHESLLRAFDLPVPSPPTYFPHLSLVYADLTPEVKDRIIAAMRDGGEVVDTMTHSGASVDIVGEGSFAPVEILLVRTGGPPKEWEVLGRVEL